MSASSPTEGGAEAEKKPLLGNTPREPARAPILPFMIDFKVLVASIWDWVFMIDFKVLVESIWDWVFPLSPAERDPEYTGRRLRWDRFDKRLHGYPTFSAHLASAPNFHVGRDYKEARIRVRLHKMYAVEEKLKELKKLDEEQEALNPYSVGSIKYDLVKFKGARQTLIDGLDVALRELDEIQLREAQYNALPRLSSCDRRSLMMYLYHRKPICKPEEDMFLCGPELIALGQTEQLSWLDSAVESWIHWLPNCVQRLFIPTEYQADDDDVTFLYKRERVAVVSTVILVTFTVGSIILPLWLLFNVYKSQGAKLGVVILFITAFPVLQVACARSRYEVIGTSAAYAAIIAAFLSNTPVVP